MQAPITLVVDDSGVMRKLVIRTLNETEFKPSKIIEAGDGAQGLSKFVEEPKIDLILSDWNMPNMDGLTFVKKIREKDKDVVILMITTEGTMGKMEAALEEGVDNYVVKPFKAEDLDRKLKKAFERLTKA
jgi:two-component system chemotaxis response regulator CheY